MYKVYIVGNPNSGKTTLFNSITKSSEHTGNWHGVTVEKTSKIIKFESNEYEIIDLPGIYSLNPFSMEENVSVDEINSIENDKILYLLDANNFKRSMLLALNLLMLNKNIKILINNYNKFSKSGGQIDTQYLCRILGCEVEIIDARKIKITENFFNFKTVPTPLVKTLANEINSKQENTINNSINNYKEIQKYKNIEILYKYILKISNNCTKNKNIIDKYYKIDKNMLKISVFLPIFILFIFTVIYLTFFIIGPIIGDLFLNLLNILIQKPIINILKLSTNSRFVLSLFEEGIFGACFGVLGFLPQICLMYIFLTFFESSGFISRMAFLLDDLLQKVGLNGKIVYSLLMGFGCSTTATLTARNMVDKNSQIKSSLLISFISCSAKLPIYLTMVLALFSGFGVWVIFGMYLLGIVLAVIMAIVLEKTILPTGQTDFIIEFPPLRFPKFFEIFNSVKSTCKQFLVKVFGVIFGASVLIWLLSNVNIKFEYVGETSKSILYSFSTIVAWIFKPIGLNNPNIICALLIGLVAKEMILSSFAISNKVKSVSMIAASLTVATNPICFNVASGISFLVFTLLYFPCISTFGVLLKQVGRRFAIMGCLMQLVVAYTTSYIVYNIATKGFVQLIVGLIVFLICIVSIKILYQKAKNKKLFCNCINCNKCKK